MINTTFVFSFRLYLMTKMYVHTPFIFGVEYHIVLGTVFNFIYPNEKVMKTETIEVYKCDYCKKLYQIKRFAIAHEVVCNKNPENERPCLMGCKHLIKKDANVSIGIDDYYSCEPIYEIKSLLYCEKKKTFLYPPKSEHKGTYFTEFYNDENENNPMPIECEEFDM